MNRQRPTPKDAARLRKLARNRKIALERSHARAMVLARFRGYSPENLVRLKTAHFMQTHSRAGHNQERNAVARNWERMQNSNHLQLKNKGIKMARHRAHPSNLETKVMNPNRAKHFANLYTNGNILVYLKALGMNTSRRR